jgi:uncharacterized protein YcbX
MHLAGLTIYPLKSARGLPLEAARVEPRGLRWDRRWMVVDASGAFVTARGHPALATVAVDLDDPLGDAARLTIRVPSRHSGTHDVQVSSEASGPSVPVVVWGEHLSAVAPSSEADGALSEWLGARVRLVAFPEAAHRPCDPRYAAAGDHTAFADGFPVLVTTTASLAAVSQAVGASVPIGRFRPNLVVDNGDDPARAWEEDSWSHLALGAEPASFRLRCVKPCARCVMVNVDPATGRAGREPLRALTRLRRQLDSAGPAGVHFGQNAVLDGEGLLSLGAPARLISRRAP